MQVLEINHSDVNLIIVHETVSEFAFKLFLNYFTILAFIGVGIWWNSVVMQIVGAIVAAISIMLNLSRVKTRHVTPTEAIDILMEKFPNEPIDIDIIV